MTRQEIFDTVVCHLNTMPHRSLLKDNCAYRSSDGLKCAVGCLIPDDVYDPAMEHITIEALIEGARQWGLPAFFCRENIRFLGRLQSTHDFAPNWKADSKGPSKAMANELTAIAAHYGLSTAVLHEVAPQ